MRERLDLVCQQLGLKREPNELVMTRGNTPTPSEAEIEADTAPPVPDSGDVRAHETEAPKTRVPRIERYRER